MELQSLSRIFMKNKLKFLKSWCGGGEAQADLLPSSLQDFIKASQICCVSEIVMFCMEVTVSLLL